MKDIEFQHIVEERVAGLREHILVVPIPRGDDSDDDEPLVSTVSIRCIDPEGRLRVDIDFDAMMTKDGTHCTVEAFGPNGEYRATFILEGIDR